MKEDINEDAYGFTLLWTEDFCKIMDMIGAKATVLSYIIANTELGSNMYYRSVRETAMSAGVCNTVAADMIRMLVACNFMKAIKGGRYMVNPSIMMRGNSRKRGYLRDKYNKIGAKPLPPLQPNENF